MINILMATYNGEKYLDEQLNSIMMQRYKDWKLYISDDGSTDKTSQIIEKFRKKHSQRVFLLPKSNTCRVGGGAAKNFFRLLLAVKTEIKSHDDYVAFCDQDDMWLPEKLEAVIYKMKEIESECGKKTPVLVHSDLKVVDENLSIISNSFFDFQKISPNRTKLENYMVQNNVTGCTMLINKPILDLIDFAPNNCTMHDWWIALIAATHGKISCVMKPLVLYRQHGKNEVGAKNAKSLKFIAGKLKNIEKLKMNYREMFSQAEIFLEHYGESISAEQRLILEQFVSMKDMNRIGKIIKIVKYKFYKNTFSRVVGEFLLI